MYCQYYMGRNEIRPMNIELLKENRVHGDVMFPLGVYSISSRCANPILDCHWHDEFEFLLVNEGIAVFQIGTRYHEVSAGEAIFVYSGELHAGYTLRDSKCSFCAVVFDPRLLNSNPFDAIQSKYIMPLQKKRFNLPEHIKGTTDWEKEVLYRLREIINKAASKPYAYELLLKAHLYYIFSAILSNCESSLEAKSRAVDLEKVENIKNVLRYIQLNYHRKMRLKDLARQLNMSEGHFCRFFRQMVRKTPMDYINFYRITKAAGLLENSGKKIIDIAMEVGFDNSSYFISMFKRYMDCTPSQYRKMRR